MAGFDKIEIDYNSDFGDLERILQSIQRQGDFAISGRMEIPMPRLEVAGVGVLSFPVALSQISQLISSAQRAPYGKGAETIVDEGVRKVWQISADKVQITGKSWDSNLRLILEQVAVGLGCDPATVSPDLYKLLVYERGGFFLPHRDTEKTEGMFGTLVIVLPSFHSGGELIVRHGSAEKTIDLSQADVSEIGFAAFYADCEHEVRPIMEGHRVCLVYNLIQTSAQGTPKKSVIQAPNYELEIAGLEKILTDHLRNDAAPAKIAWLLEHQYSPAGLSLAGLKSADAGRAQALAAAASKANCSVHLGIVHIEEGGPAETDYDPYRSRSRWGRGNSFEPSENSPPPNFSIVEISHRSAYISDWKTLNGGICSFGKIPLEPGELLPNRALDKEKPDAVRVMEATGNEGASFERSYHRAVVVLWPAERFFDLMLQVGVGPALAFLNESLRASAWAIAEPQFKKNVQKIVDAWPIHDEWHRKYYSISIEDRVPMLELLAQLSDSKLINSFLYRVVKEEFDGSETKPLLLGLKQIGAAGAKAFLEAMLSVRGAQKPAECLALLEKALMDAPKGESLVWRAALGDAAQALLASLEKRILHPPDRFDRRYAESQPLNSKFVASLLKFLKKLHAASLAETVADFLALHPGSFDPVSVLVPAIEANKDWDAPSDKLWKHCAEFLLRRSETPPERPKDWSMDAKFSCKCDLCNELSAFARDPHQQIHRFRVRQDLRSHIEGQIRNNGLDMACVTEEKGSPKTLICTKDLRTFEANCKTYLEDIKTMSSLVAMQGKIPAKTPAHASLSDRISAAITRAQTWTP
jgi:hypothetical protein